MIDATRVAKNLIHVPYVWVAVGALYLTDAIWCWRIGLTLSDYSGFLTIICVLLAVTALLRGKQRDPRLAVASEVWALWMMFANSANLLTYLAATPALPLRDEFFAGLDIDLGFQWMALFNLVQAHPGINRLLSICYDSLIPEILVLSIFLSFARLDRRLREFFWIAYIAILLTSVISSLAPSVSAFPGHGLAGKAGWLHDLGLLRGGADLRFALPDMVGLVTFPSFHAVLALLVIYITRRTGLAGHLFAFWNVIMLVSIVPLGGHYLVDIIGGAGVLAIAIMAHRWAVRLHGRFDGYRIPRGKHAAA